MQILFLHDTLTPENVRAVVESDVVPPVGAIVRLPGALEDGRESWWRVADQEWKWVPPVPDGILARPGHWSIVVRCTDA